MVEEDSEIPSKTYIASKLLNQKHVPEKKRYECDECEFSTNVNRKALRRHVLRVHRKILQHKCDHHMCEYAASSPSALRVHKRVHANEKEFKCDLCDYQANTKASIYTHKKTKHFIMMSDEDLVRRSQAYKCSRCAFTTYSSSHLRNHEATHISKEYKLHSCKICDFRGSRADHIRNHILSVHEKKEKTLLTCEKCDFTAKAQKTMQNHVSKCVGTHPYTCTKCEYKTAVLKNLYAHAETHVLKA